MSTVVCCRLILQLILLFFYIIFWCWCWSLFRIITSELECTDSRFGKVCHWEEGFQCTKLRNCHCDRYGFKLDKMKLVLKTKNALLTEGKLHSSWSFCLYLCVIILINSFMQQALETAMSWSLFLFQWRSQDFSMGEGQLGAGLIRRGRHEVEVLQTRICGQFYIKCVISVLILYGLKVQTASKWQFAN